MNSVRFVLDLNGLRELMKSDAMQGCLQAAGDEVAGNGASMSGGQSYGTRMGMGSYTAICTVFPNDDEARKENFSNNTVLKALTASGLPMNK